MTVIITRANKGSALTNAEMDQNFTALDAEKLTFIVNGVTSGATITPSVLDDQYNVTALAAAATIAAPAGTPVNGKRMMIRIKDNGTARALTWNAIYQAVGITLPTTTVINKTVYVGLAYNSTAVKWDAIFLAQEA